MNKKYKLIPINIKLLNNIQIIGWRDEEKENEKENRNKDLNKTYNKNYDRNWSTKKINKIKIKMKKLIDQNKNEQIIHKEKKCHLYKWI